MPATLLRASIDGALVVAAIWLLTRFLPRLPPSTSAALWWCAAAKFVVGLFWITPIAIPVLPDEAYVRLKAEVTASADVTKPNDPTRVRTENDRMKAAASRDTTAAGDRVLAAFGSTTATVLFAAWAIGVLVAMFVVSHRWWRTTGIVRRACSAPLEIQMTAADLASRLRLRRVPDVRVSREIDTPLVTGLLRPAVLVPAARFGTRSLLQQQMALCHELAHIARRDLWLGCVPALAERLFFFHPLVRLASREYLFWRESACDATVLDVLGAAPQEYGRLLLDLGVAQPGTSLAAAGAPWSFENLKRRIVMLRDPSTRSLKSRLVAAASIGLAVAATVPVQLTARPTAGAVVPADRESLRPRAAEIDTPVPPARLAQRERSRSEERDLTYVLVLSESRNHRRGSGEDVERAKSFRRGDEPLLWFRLGVREYVARDPAVLRQIEEIWRPVDVLGDTLGKLGTEQGLLGTKQGEIGTRQGQIGTEQGWLGTRQGELGTRQALMAARELERMTAAQRAEFDKDRRQIELEMRELDREMRALGAKMRELDKPMRDLGAEMDVLGKEMERLGRQMEGEGRKAEQEMRRILQRLVDSGVAENVK